MLSWIMALWLNKHEKSEWPVLPVSQPDDAIHVTNSEEHPSREDIEKMCSQGFFTRHKYLYVDSGRQNETDTAEVYEHSHTNSQLPPPQGFLAFRQSVPSNHSDGASNVADEYETNQVSNATETVFEESTSWRIRNVEHTAESVESTDSISSCPTEASEVSNEDQRLENHTDGVACAYSLYGEGHATGVENAKDDSEGGHILYENAGYKDLTLTRECYMPLRNNQVEPKIPGYINALAEETGVPLSQIEYGNRGTPADPDMCVDLATTESLSSNELDPNIEEQPSFTFYEDMAILILLLQLIFIYFLS